MKTLIILRGVPGCGKSTVAEVLSNNGKYPVCTADDFFMKDGEYKWNPKQLGNRCQLLGSIGPYRAQKRGL